MLKIRLFSVLALVVCCLPGAAQDKDWPADRPPRAWVRRISLGPTISILGTDLTKDREASEVTTTINALYSSINLRKRLGYGATAQVALTERFAVNLRFLVRKIGYQATSDIISGTDDTTTPNDERIRTIRNEDTRATLFDVPLTLRFFGTPRHEPGQRWFVEGGGAVRRVSRIKSRRDQRVGTAPVVCCDLSPVTPAARDIRGLVAGFGFHLVDPVGIRVIPEVRYTRWMGRTFESTATRTEKNQIEVVLSLMF